MQILRPKTRRALSGIYKHVLRFLTISDETTSQGPNASLYAWLGEGRCGRFEREVNKRRSNRSLSRLALLTPREQQVYSWLARGATNRQIGSALGISSRTVEKHVGRILVKLGVENRTRAALLMKRVNQN